MNDLLWILIALLGGAALFISGWNAAVAKHRAGRRRLIGHVADLEQQIAIFNEERNRDPQRGWTNVGARYALGQMEATIASIRADLAERSKERHTT